MKNEAKSYTIELCGDTYTIISDESQQHIQDVIAYVQLQLDDCLAKEDRKDHQTIKKVAILSLLRLASELIHMQGNFHQQVQNQEMLVHQIDRLLQSFS